MTVTETLQAMETNGGKFPAGMGETTSFLFEQFPKIPRLRRECVITEKIDGTNAQILVTESIGQHTFGIPLHRALPNGPWIAAGSRNRWITPESDNYGFARWVYDNAEQLIRLGPGRHFGEWWGLGIQRRYGQTEKHFSLFNVARWMDVHSNPLGVTLKSEFCPPCCKVVPVLYRGPFCTTVIDGILKALRYDGSQAAPGFMQPEGIIIYHTASKQLFKQTLENDDQPKSS